MVPIGSEDNAAASLIEMGQLEKKDVFFVGTNKTI
jgi:hypothetical protein